MNKSVFLDTGRHQQQGLNYFIEKLGIDESWEVVSFEPNPQLFGHPLSDRRIRGINLILRNEAIWALNGRVSFGLYENNVTSQGCLI